jgi:hypothetical protein
MSKIALLDTTSVAQILLWVKVLFIYAIDLREQYGAKKIPLACRLRIKTNLGRLKNI